jgi:hypothetical protein
VARTQLRHISLQPPEGWEAHIMLAFCGPEPTHPYAAPPLPNITLNWEALGKGETFRTHVDRDITSLGRRIPDLQISGRAAVVVGGRNAEQVRYLWTSPRNGKVDEALVLVPPEGDAREVALLTVAASPSQAEESHAAFAALLQTVRFGPKLPADAPTRYRALDLSFDPPPGWYDATIVTFNEAKADGAWIFMTMDWLRKDQTLRVHASARLAVLAAGGAPMDVLATNDIKVGGRAAVETRVRRPSSPKEGPLEQSFVVVDRGPSSDEIVRFDLVVPAADAKVAQARLAELLASVEFETTPPPEPR